ncbi:MAG: DUF4386 domain-containing protein [Thermoplasmata archaeon]|nr:MAG: DUF4386 domain-containing protein [Thermoplasmata archaeon]
MFGKNSIKNTKNGTAKNVNANNGAGLFGSLTQSRSARVAGLLYLLLIIFGVTAELLRQSIIVPGDASATAANLMNNEGIWKLSIMVDIIAFTSFALLPFAFYRVFNKVNKNLAMLVIIFILVSIPISVIAWTYQYGAIELVSTPALVMDNIETYTAYVHAATIFHGLWLFPLGILTYKSGYFPKFWGILQMLACVGFVIEGSQYFLLPGNEAIAYPGMMIAVIAEFGFTGWLLVKGAKIPEVESNEKVSKEVRMNTSVA